MPYGVCLDRALLIPLLTWMLRSCFISLPLLQGKILYVPCTFHCKCRVAPSPARDLDICLGEDISPQNSESSVVIWI
ncbi:hypothetical protein M440DRAFT_1012891 [Trichoderma longibrachiatum ATCC 18648]|uniref:Uncharacterized protein n=1 Tax=Trichoderma longibrachiatum ATCC 18648 TaxID=983965 RepID=A0A2T4CID9_TRILO|nr:hypothetical protein M440DRAFT_1012891 [Trichoderma longibrachiatum ATCC 18648]